MLLLLARGRELPSRQSHALELVGYGQLDDTSGRTVDQRPVGQFTETHLGVALLAEGVEYHRSRRAPLQLLLIRLARQQYLLRSPGTLLQPDGVVAHPGPPLVTLKERSARRIVDGALKVEAIRLRLPGHRG